MLLMRTRSSTQCIDLHHTASTGLGTLAAIGCNIEPRSFGMADAGVGTAVTAATNMRVGRFKVALSIVVARAALRVDAGTDAGDDDRQSGKKARCSTEDHGESRLKICMRLDYVYPGPLDK